MNNELDISVKKDGNVYKLTVEEKHSGIKTEALLTYDETRGLRDKIVDALEQS